MGDLASRVDRVIEDNRTTIAVVFPIVGAFLLVASALGLLDGAWSWLAFNPWLILVGVVVMRSPLVAGLAPLCDRRLLAVVAGLVAYTYGIEAIGLATGVPYGEFAYQVALGPTVAGVPVALPVLFLPLVFDAYLVTVLVLERWALRSRALRVASCVGIVVGLDLVLDPGAVALGFWTYAKPGIFHGVPWTNYAGWTLSGLVTVLGIEVGIDRERLVRRARSCPFLLDDVVSFVLLWGAINVAFGNLVPAAFAVGLGGLVHAAEGFDARVWPWVAPDRGLAGGSG